MQLAGELAKISLSSLMQLVRNGALTGEIALSQGARAATVFIENGRPVHVESDMGDGRDALLELFLWLTGTFSFIEGKLPDIPKTIAADEPVDRLLREGALYLEQKKYLDQLRITGQSVLMPTESAKQVSNDGLLARLDGKRTLGQALADAQLTRREYVQAVHRLLSDELVVVNELELPPPDGQINLPDWVIARLQQDNPDVTKSIVEMVIWVDRVKCWLYQADADLARLVDEMTQTKLSSGSSASPHSVEF